MSLEQAAQATEGRIGRVPIRNLWVLMLYASDLFRELDEASVAVDEQLEDIPDLVAEILLRAAEQRLRRALTTGYESRVSELTRVRGRIDVVASQRKRSLQRGRVVCRYETLTVDTPRNRLIRAALAAMARLAGDPDLTRRCLGLERALVEMGVRRSGATRELLAQGRLGRHEQQDRLVISAARLALQLALPTEETGDQKLFSPDREEGWVRRLFERGVGGLYATVLGPQGWRITRGMGLGWQAARRTEGVDAILPSMKTDIVLDPPGGGRRLVIDTKFTSIVTKGWYREETLKSGYLYQLYAYLRSQEGGVDERADLASGMLLHPSVGGDVDESVEIQGHVIRFATVDLTRKPREIRDRLISLAQPVWA